MMPVKPKKAVCDECRRLPPAWGVEFEDGTQKEVCTRCYERIVKEQQEEATQ